MEMLAATARTFIGNKDAQKIATDAFHTIAKGADPLTRSMRRKAPHHVSARPHAAVASKPDRNATLDVRTKATFTPSTQSADEIRHATERVGTCTSTGVDVGVGDWMSNLEKLHRMAWGGR